MLSETGWDDEVQCQAGTEQTHSKPKHSELFLEAQILEDECEPNP